MVNPVVESARYLTEMGYDVLIFSLLSFLAQGEDRTKFGGLNAADWLKSQWFFFGCNTSFT